jgi:AICAR transformylase/IMP cyclohydrolase PurH
MQSLELKYGLNPNQKPARIFSDAGALPVSVLSGRPGYINFLDALNGWQLVRELRAATGLPAAASFSNVSPAGAAGGRALTESLRRSFSCPRAKPSPPRRRLRPRPGADRMSSFGDFIALSDACDPDTARLIAREVSDGIIAPGYHPEALEILTKKRKGAYNVIEVDPPLCAARRRCAHGFWRHLEQARNDVTIDAALLENVVSREKAIPRGRGAGPGRGHDRPQVTPSPIPRLRGKRPDHRRGRGAAVPQPLHAAGRRQADLSSCASTRRRWRCPSKVDSPARNGQLRGRIPPEPAGNL